MRTGERQESVAGVTYMWNAQVASLEISETLFTVTLYLPSVAAGILLFTGADLESALSYAYGIR